MFAVPLVVDLHQWHRDRWRQGNIDGRDCDVEMMYYFDPALHQCHQHLIWIPSLSSSRTREEDTSIIDDANAMYRSSKGSSDDQGRV